jgi:hypothetical protein
MKTLADIIRAHCIKHGIPYEATGLDPLCGCPMYRRESQCIHTQDDLLNWQVLDDHVRTTLKEAR